MNFTEIMLELCHYHRSARARMNAGVWVGEREGERMWSAIVRKTVDREV